MDKDYKELQKKAFSSDFVKYCKKNIVKDLRELEKTRKTRIHIIIAIYVIAFFAMIGLFCYFIIEKETINLGSLIVPFGIAGTIHSIMLKVYQTAAKAIILPKLISYIGHFQTVSSDLVSEKLNAYIKNTELFSSYNRFHCEDCFTGTYKDVELNVAEIHLKKVKKSGKKTSSVTIFEGLFLHFNFNKKFSGITTVKRDGLKLFNKETRVNLEDPEFEKLYDVESTDQIEARYLLTPAFMNRMVELSKRPVGAEGIMVSFKDGRINIAVSSSKDWFEIPMSKPATEISNYRAIVLELVSILSIIDTLKLDENTGM